ncbi:MAG: tripartite tricarboxylate transporter TctB family protein [Desulfobacteraceae bacterium]|jgi:preprotein translocase subunit SecG
MRKSTSVTVEGLIWITIACVAFVLTYQFNEPLPQYRYGASGWPRTLLLAIAVFAVIQVVWSVFLSRRKGVIAESEGHVSESLSTDSSASATTYLKRVGAFVIPLLYLFLMPRAGFYIVTPLFIPGYMALLGERRWVHLVGTTLLIYVLSLVVFTKLLYVPLPVGNWPGFYDINSFFVALIK